MAIAGNLPVASGDSLTNLMNLINGFKDQTNTSETKSNITPEGLQHLVNQVLGGSQGLASIAQGQKSAGLYNSTTNQLLTNDLVTRVAGEAAAKAAGTTTKNTTPAKMNGKDVLGLMAIAGGKSLLGPLVSGVGKKLGTDQWGNKIADTVLGNSGTDTAVTAATGSLAADDTGDMIAATFGSGVTDALTIFGSSIASDAAAGAVVDTTTDVAGEAAADSFWSSFWG